MFARNTAHAHYISSSYLACNMQYEMAAYFLLAAIVGGTLFSFILPFKTWFGCVFGVLCMVCLLNRHKIAILLRVAPRDIRSVVIAICLHVHVPIFASDL